MRGLEVALHKVRYAVSRCPFAAAFWYIAFAAAARCATAGYMLNTIDYPGAALTNVYGLNNAGDVVGEYANVAGDFHSFVLRDGVYESFDVPNTLGSTAFDINDTGQIVGVYGIHGVYKGVAGVFTQAFLLNEGVFTDIVPLSGSPFIVARSINDAGTIVGSYWNADDVDRGFTYNGTTFTTFNRPGAIGTVPLQGNNVGGMVGTYRASGQLRGFRLSGGSYTTLSYPSAPLTVPGGINDSGLIVGFYQDVSGQEHGFQLKGGIYSVLDVAGASGTRVNAINNGGHIVGSYDDDLGTHGFLMTPTAAADFDASGSVDADDLGTWSANYGKTSSAAPNEGDADIDGDVDAFDFLLWQKQLTASAAVSTPVPEPVALASAATVALCVLAHARRSRGAFGLRR